MDRFWLLIPLAPVYGLILFFAVCGGLNLLADFLDWLDRDLQSKGSK